MRHRASIFLAHLTLVAAPLALACTGTETGNGFTQEIRVSAHSSDEGAFAIAVASGGGVVSEAWVIIGAMTLIEDGGCDEGGDGVVMPVQGAADQALGAVSLAVEMNEGDYCELTVPLGGAGEIPAGAPAGLGAETAIAVIGQTALGTNFSIIGQAPRISVRGGAPFSLGEADGDLFLGFDVASWLVGLDIDGGEVSGGQVIIDASNNAALAAAFNANVAAGVELFRDQNGNGRADPEDERIAAGQ